MREPAGASPGAIDRIFPLPHVGAATDEQLLRWYDAAEPPPDRPWVRFNFIASLDGSATLHGLSGALSGAADKRIFQLLRRHTDVILVGAQTIRSEGYGGHLLEPADVQWRREHGRPAHPPLVIVSGSLQLDPSGPVFTEAPVRPIIVAGRHVHPDRLREFEPVADLIICGQDRIDVEMMLSELAGRGHRQVLCEGGPHLFGSFEQVHRVDELCLSLSPALVGGSDMRIAAGSVDPPSAAMSLSHVLESEGTLFLRYLAAD